MFKKPVPLHSTRAMTQQMLVALKSIDVAHCDIKPGTLLVKSRHFRGKLIDFCKATGVQIQRAKIQGPVNGAPEVFLAPPLNKLLDVWSLSSASAILINSDLCVRQAVSVQHYSTRWNVLVCPALTEFKSFFKPCFSGWGHDKRAQLRWTTFYICDQNSVSIKWM